MQALFDLFRIRDKKNLIVLVVALVAVSFVIPTATKNIWALTAGAACLLLAILLVKQYVIKAQLDTLVEELMLWINEYAPEKWVLTKMPDGNINIQREDGASLNVLSFEIQASSARSNADILWRYPSDNFNPIQSINRARNSFGKSLTSLFIKKRKQPILFKGEADDLVAYILELE